MAAQTTQDFVILVRVFDEGASCSLKKFLALPTCNIGTGENMFATIEACVVLVFTHLTIIRNVIRVEYVW